MKIAKFEDIKAWQKAKELTKYIYDVTNKGDFAKDYSLKDQIRRASIEAARLTTGFIKYLQGKSRQSADDYRLVTMD